MKHEREKVINEVMKAFNLTEKDRFAVQCFIDGTYEVGKMDGKEEAKTEIMQAVKHQLGL